jgi:hypothetical protein
VPSGPQMAVRQTELAICTDMYSGVGSKRLYREQHHVAVVIADCALSVLRWV